MLLGLAGQSAVIGVGANYQYIFFLFGVAWGASGKGSHQAR